MTKNDKILIGIVLVISLLGYIGICFLNHDDSRLSAEISVAGSLFMIIDLNNPPANKTINIPGHMGDSIVQVKKGAIRMQFSPCPDHYCMKTGWIHHSGQTIACIPNKVIIKISSPQDPIDAVSH